MEHAKVFAEVKFFFSLDIQFNVIVNEYHKKCGAESNAAQMQKVLGKQVVVPVWTPLVFVKYIEKSNFLMA